MTGDSDDGVVAQLDGTVKCPHCGYLGEDYRETKNLTGQRVLVCPECEGWQ